MTLQVGILLVISAASGILANDISFTLPPDTRPRGCEAQLEDPEGNDFADLTVSIVIPYRNETLEHIKGSVASILHFTPKNLLNEILFVSDGNSVEATFFVELRAISPLISVIVFPEPGEGLIVAKMRAVGAVSLKSSVLIFLEPHIRCNRAWLEPLLRRIRTNPAALAMPALDPIPHDDFHGYLEAALGHWRFEWNLNLIYTSAGHNAGSRMTAEPYASPATSGGIFAIRKDWWDKLGFYDHGMLGWGGDHVEATMKVWRCGGRIEVVPCSRVGHLFRSPESRPYDVSVTQVVQNYARMVAIWFDEYSEYFFKVKKEARAMDIGNVSEQLALRERLQCKGMKWYLENVDRELLWEKDHICVPGCDRKTVSLVCCESNENVGRSTLDRIMPASEYRPISPSLHDGREEAAKDEL